MKLFGSTTSPFVRRIRMVLANTDHDFVDMQIFAEGDRAELARRNPTLKIPCLDDEGQMIFDSRIIYRYLAQKFGHSPLTWEQENQLTLIDAANDSLVQLLLLKRSDFDTNDDRLFFRLQKERVESVFDELESQLNAGGFSQWQYPEISLFTLIDWVEFRELHDLAAYPALKAFRNQHAQRIEATATDPRQ